MAVIVKRPRWVNWLCFFCVLSLVGCASYSEYVRELNKKATEKRQAERQSAALADSSMDLGPIEIVGDDDFKSKVGDAVTWVSSQDESAYEELSKYIQTIEQSQKSTINVRTKTYTMAQQPVTGKHWLAAIIFREAYHSKLYWDYKAEHPDMEPPPSVYIGTEDAELACNAYAADMIERLEGPSSIVSSLRTATITIDQK